MATSMGSRRTRPDQGWSSRGHLRSTSRHPPDGGTRPYLPVCRVQGVVGGPVPSVGRRPATSPTGVHLAEPEAAPIRYKYVPAHMEEVTMLKRIPALITPDLLYSL